MVGKVLYRTVAIRRLHAKVLLGDLADGPLSSFQDTIKTFRQLIRIERARFQILGIDEGRQPPGIPAMKSPVANNHGWNRSDPVQLQVHHRFWLCFNINRFIGNPP